MDLSLSALFDELAQRPALAGWIVITSVVLFVASIVAIPIVFGRMRADYFLSPRAPTESWTRRHYALRWTVLVLKNLLGVILLLAGIAMLVLPGQGILAILVGISLLNFPGKRWLELRIVRQRYVLRTINWIRQKARRDPLLLPERDD